MRYMLMLHADEAAGRSIEPEDMVRFMGQMYAYQQALEKAAAFVSSNALVSSSEASLVRVQGNEISVLDGPYADVREQFGGYFIIDVADTDEANKWAARCPAATWGTVEVRRIRDSSEYAG
ncbi:YciI family protein [Rhizobium lentis]|uniref:YCII-related domain-containing protein n=1 Tax=Rhizobium lentis TaxID=1138194 RepID=A0A9Q3QY60_9HYPH|nr:YciI family protein [Rhizobium lentis]MBX4954537.1 hypothetical protein [Rhizobium lentis]MBX4971937.1 hypothetical protein [Rhizobium lentis]MBX4984544.1 hypothetical protein [Rhizobium lentis]MBX4996465.1 hypothetical protein [Rhizobium lentis]MBX5002477.1 hypothetical protein [Rhizobium lentis]